MSIALITGAAGLVGSESVRKFAEDGIDVIGIDNDMRAQLFGAGASTSLVRENLQASIPNYHHMDIDVRDKEALEKVFKKYGHRIVLIVHAAAQPSHDWSATDPMMDFSINATATLSLLELTRQHCPEAVFIFASTNKVYGDRPNHFQFIEEGTRWVLAQDDVLAKYGFDETLSIDSCIHSPFGASKVSADIMTQEYGRYFGLKTTCFRGGCLTGPNHVGAELHGFLAYLAKCVVYAHPYKVFGYKGKQVRDNIHVEDLVDAFRCVFKRPKNGEVYNIGGGPFANCSVIEAIRLFEDKNKSKLDFTLSDQVRTGDHIWWISDTRKFQTAYPEWQQQHDIDRTATDIIQRLKFLKNT